MNAYQIIRCPLITEKNTSLMEEGKYCFEIDPRANKHQVKRAVEQIFNVTVERVHTINIRPKKKRRGREFGYTSGRKKAIVTLAAGQSLDFSV